MGNGGLLCVWIYFFKRKPVSGEALANRGLMAAAGYAMCAAVMFFKHKHKHNEVSFIHVVGSSAFMIPNANGRYSLPSE